MAGRDEHLVLEKFLAAPVGVDAAGVADVVTVALEKTSQCEFGPKIVVGEVQAARDDRSVVAHGARASRWIGEIVEIVATPGVVGLPGRVGGLHQQIGLPVVVPNDEDNVALAKHTVLANELRDVDA